MIVADEIFDDRKPSVWILEKNKVENAGCIHYPPETRYLYYLYYLALHGVRLYA
jgi:hypothetical protein